MYLATLTGLAASSANNTLFVPSASEAPTRFLLDSNGSAAAGCSAVVYLKSMDAGYCAFKDSVYTSLVAGITAVQALACNEQLADATAFLYADNTLSFMDLQLSVAANGAVVFAGANETVAPVVPVPAAGEAHMGGRPDPLVHREQQQPTPTLPRPPRAPQAFRTAPPPRSRRSS